MKTRFSIIKNRITHITKPFKVSNIELMEIIIHPYQGIEIPGKGRISFGMTRKRVRSFFSEQPKEVLVNETSDMPTDMYNKASLQFSYKLPGLLKSITIAPIQDPIFQGQHLLHTPYHKIEAWFKQLDPNLEIEEYEGLTSYSFGIILWAPDADEQELDYQAESVFIFEREYYTK